MRHAIRISSVGGTAAGGISSGAGDEPAVLLLDEPLGALDLKVRRRMQLELKRIHREVGITFLYVTHDQEEALVLSDRIAVMNRGRLEQLDWVENIYLCPRSKYVSDFIGDINLFSGTLVASYQQRYDPTDRRGRCPKCRRQR